MSKVAKRPYSHALPVAQEIVAKLAHHCQRIEIAGSLRRQREMIGDIEIVAVPIYNTDLFGQPLHSHPSVLDTFFEQKGVPLLVGGKLHKVGQREAQKRFIYNGYQVDLFLPTMETWGSIFTIRTGSHDFNMWLMNERCRQVGIRFSNGRLFEWKNEISTPEEGDVFKALKMEFVPPNHRDDNRWAEYLH